MRCLTLLTIEHLLHNMLLTADQYEVDVKKEWIYERSKASVFCSGYATTY